MAVSDVVKYYFGTLLWMLFTCEDDCLREPGRVDCVFLKHCLTVPLSLFLVVGMSPWEVGFDWVDQLVVVNENRIVDHCCDYCGDSEFASGRVAIDPY